MTRVQQGFDRKGFLVEVREEEERIKMRALLIQHGCEAGLEVLPEDMEAQAKNKLNKKAHSAVILCLGNKVLREVTRETTAAGVWSKLETLYMKKSLANKLYLKKKLYTFCMPVGRKISEHIDEFNKIVLDIKVKFEDEYLALLLLTSLLASYEHFVDTLLYRREALTLEGVMATLNSKEIKERSKAKGDDGEGLYMRGRTNNRDSSQSRGKSRSKSQGDDGDEHTCSARLDHGFRMFIPHDTQSGKIKVINGSRVVLSGTRRDNCVYSLDGHAVAGELNASVEEKDSLAQVWHKRLGHISEAGLQVLEKHGLFGKKSLDLWGLSQVESLGGKRYFLSIVDDYSRRVWVYILWFKHEAFGKFKEWKQLVENQTRRTVKKLRTDNGLEFCNREFEQLCIKSGIARHLIVVGMLQQNGSPSRAIEKKTPMEMWSGHPSDYEMLRIFGCVAYPHDKQGKLEPRAVKCVLLGYPKGMKGYKLYRLDDESPKIVTSRNVVFNESVMYKDTLKNSGVGDKSVEELQVEVELQRLNNHTPEEDQIDHEDGDDEDARDQETNQPLDLTNYQLEEYTHEPLTYQEAVACEDSSKWKAAIEEEMDSLRKNKTWELVDPLAGQKLFNTLSISPRGSGIRTTLSWQTISALFLDNQSIPMITSKLPCPKGLGEVTQSLLLALDLDHEDSGSYTPFHT
ncbi:retrovirus-related pol polyprotein from transposon TNT 1-94 [Tanacetum coccineum]|uniref:Retrovirus-related pol polyprotein from transposon TNT 1-94 n=1 Tax=Tanacetum coccineum TaxID=301880 RepID=A0ABQ5D0G1_9ASTR